jgi:hypothetical protein
VLRGTNCGDVATGARPDNHDIKFSAHRLPDSSNL